MKLVLLWLSFIKDFTEPDYWRLGFDLIMSFFKFCWDTVKDAALLANELVDYRVKHKAPRILCELDLAKAYDPVNRKFLLKVEYILDLQKQLTLLGAEPKNVSNGGLSEEPLASVTPMHKIRSQLDDAVANDCPFCGELMIREISLPFILPEAAEESESWEIKPHNHPSQRSLSLCVILSSVSGELLIREVSPCNCLFEVFPRK
ncbi:hypothetical protein FXO38_24716 [Capsicum annuum]|nr:hypothetical protein FXO37_27072 [Capsicum annuum]KAF3635246.1 hypothetical protein FXO38_24716 [Capsicum annuum]